MLDKDLMNKALDNLALEIVKRFGSGVYMEVFVVGGAALLYKDIRDNTVDVDALYPEKYITRDLVHKVADNLDLPIDWFNRDFIYTSSFSPKLKDFSKREKQYRQVLTVYTVNDLTLLCMKLVSFRYNNHDIRDINALQKRINNLSTDMLKNHLKTLYGNGVIETLSPRAREFVEDLKYIDPDRETLEDMIKYSKKMCGSADINSLIDSVCDAIPEVLRKDMPKDKQEQAIQYWHRYKDMLK